jgi:hypothetical protein
MSMAKSNTTSAAVRDRYAQQMSFRLSEREAKALHILAQRDGSQAAPLLRKYIREAYRAVFGKEV